MTSKQQQRSEDLTAEELSALRSLFAFGVPGGRSKVQKQIGKYLDGDDRALRKAPHIKAMMDGAVAVLTRRGKHV